MEKNNITKLFEDFNLYESKEFNLYTEKDENFSVVQNNDALNIYTFLGLLNKERLITDCVWCEDHLAFTFKIKVSDYFDQHYTSSMFLGQGNNGTGIWLDFENASYVTQKILKSTIKFKALIINYHFSCTNKPDHEYFMSLLAINDGNKIKFIKVGQFPENSSLGHFDSETYKKTLRKIDDAYIDYKNSEKSFRRGLYVGAYDYLRRVYEKMIRFYESKLPEKPKENAKAEERIKSIRHCFDSKIQDYLYPLYSALSAGVHIMTEEECKDHYQDLKTIIDIQLQKIMSEEELDNQIEKSKASLDLLNRKYGKKKAD